jgi:metallophosphoesterase (TIGR03767 family)
MGLPWYAAYGNHDGLVQGNVPRTALLQALATGPLKLTSLPPSILAQPLSVQIEFFVGLLQQDPTAVQLELSEGGRRFVTPDADRRIIDRATTVSEHFATSGTPAGHGFTADNVSASTAYYTFDVGQVRGVVLDTVVSAGGPNGSLDPAQFGWLETQLQTVSSRWLSPTGQVISRPGHNDKCIVIFSHHTVGTMDNVPAGSDRISGTEVAALLLRYPNVILWVNGHTHRNEVISHSRPSGTAVPGGFWELNTAAHIDWPEQSRIVEIVDNRDGTLSIFGTIIDHSGPVAGAAFDERFARRALREWRLTTGRTDRRPARSHRRPQRRAARACPSVSSLLQPQADLALSRLTDTIAIIAALGRAAAER